MRGRTKQARQSTPEQYHCPLLLPLILQSRPCKTTQARAHTPTAAPNCWEQRAAGGAARHAGRLKERMGADEPLSPLNHCMTLPCCSSRGRHGAVSMAQARPHTAAGGTEGVRPTNKGAGSAGPQGTKAASLGSAGDLLRAHNALTTTTATMAASSNDDSCAPTKPRCAVHQPPHPPNNPSQPRLAQAPLNPAHQQQRYNRALLPLKHDTTAHQAMALHVSCAGACAPKPRASVTTG